MSVMRMVDTTAVEDKPSIWCKAEFVHGERRRALWIHKIVNQEKKSIMLVFPERCNQTKPESFESDFETALFFSDNYNFNLVIDLSMYGMEPPDLKRIETYIDGESINHDSMVCLYFSNPDDRGAYLKYLEILEEEWMFGL